MTRLRGKEAARHHYAKRNAARVPQSEMLNLMLGMIEMRRQMEESDGRRAKISQRMAADLRRSLVQM